ncbi:MAG: TRAP transporter fused permease subunit [Gammaproteobacteria bacterium]|nr:TRAP transporter fused permease subunit [Gammaproteobacteria bacterium]
MRAVLSLLERGYLAAITLIGIAWIVNLPQFFGASFIAAEWIGLLLGIGIAAAFLRRPYSERAGAVEALLGFAAIACWLWMAFNYQDWIIDITGYTPEKYVPGIVGVVLMMEAMRKTAGLPITILVWVLIGYALLGHLVPPPFQADSIDAPSLVMYVYSDTNGVPGTVLTVIGTLVLAFIVLGRLMEITGAIKFFTDIALALMGHRRGGPAKVAVVASSIFGSINGTVIGNIMSTGIVTIPLMKRSGFKPQQAGAIEAVSSNGGQFAPPVMGATAFLIAEFLQVSYATVVLAALAPAVLYYVCLFLQVDAIAQRRGLEGLPRSELPSARAALKTGWVFLLPFVVLIYLLFWRGYDPAVSGLAAVATLFVLALLRQRHLLTREALGSLFVGAGANMLPLLMIGGGAGVVIGVMNITGLGFSLSLVLSQIGENAGLLVMLLLTGAISIVLGMGMPTTAIYVVLSVVLAPAIIEMDVSPIAAHLFIFYYGLLSFLTPPVAVASYVAAGLAGSGMWSTSWEGVKLGAAAYLLPFLWCYNEALVGEGSPLAVTYVVLTALIAAFLLGRGMQIFRFRSAKELGVGALLFAAALTVGGSTVWLGAESAASLGVAAGGAALLIGLRTFGALPGVRLAKA